MLSKLNLLLEILSAIAIGVTVISLIFGSDKGRAAFTQALKNYIGGAIDLAAGVVSDFASLLSPVVTAFVKAFEDNGSGMLDEVTGPAGEFAKKLFRDATIDLEVLGETLPEEAVATAALAIEKAFGRGIASAAVTAAFEGLLPEKLNTLNALGPIFAEMSGFKEVAENIRDPLYKYAFGVAAEYYYKSKFKPEYASEGDAVLWHSRGLLSDDLLREVFKYSGLKPKYENAFVESAYRGMSPFIMIRMMETGIFSDTETRDELTFTGLRPVSQDRAIRAAREMALIPYKQKVVTAVTAAFARGDISEFEFDDTLNNLTLPPGAVALLAQDAHYTKLEQLLQLYRRQVTQLYETGQLPDADYVPTLEAAGINNADAEAHYGLDSARLRGRQLAAAERAAARAAETLQREAVRAAEESYLSGQIDEAALATALELAGVPVAIVALLVQIMRSRRIGALVEIYGLRLNRHDAILLREKVEALKEQVIKKVFGLDGARQTLQSLGIPAANLEALLAEWAAHLKTLLQV